MNRHHFISYSSADAQDFALRLCDELAQGPPPNPVWLDKRELVAGGDWDDQIVEAIRDCASVIFVMTRDSVTSKSVCKKEWTRALKYKKPIIPILLHPDAEMPFSLEPRQHVDFKGEPMLRSITLFKRLPVLRWSPKENEQVVQPETQNQFPDLKSDFDILEHELMPSFRNLDNEALRAQNLFRLQQVILIAGGVITTTLGAVQAALMKEVWPGVAEAVVAGFLTSVSYIAREFNEQKKYFSSRLKAETLRAEYFLFLGRMGNYAGDDRVQSLIRRVADIESEEG